MESEGGESVEVECVECEVLRYWSPVRRCPECEWWMEEGSKTVETDCVEAQRQSIDSVRMEVHWRRCEIGQLQFFSVQGQLVRPDMKYTGVPRAAIAERLWKGWSGSRQGSSHPNSRFLESLDHCATRADPETMVHRRTDLCP